MWNFNDFPLTSTRKDESSIIFRLKVFERDARLLPSVDAVGSLAKVNLHLLQRMEAHVVRGLVDGGPQSVDGNIPGIDAKRSSQVYPADPIFPVPDGQYVNLITLSRLMFPNLGF